MVGGRAFLDLEDEDVVEDSFFIFSFSSTTTFLTASLPPMKDVVDVVVDNALPF